MPKQIVNISDTVKTFQEKVNIISADVGWRGNLTTTQDSDIVGAINEHDAELGTITSGAMGTTASTVSTAIAELDGRLDSANTTQINSAKLFMRDSAADNIIKGELYVHNNVDIRGNVQVDGTLTVDGVVNFKAGSSGSVTLGDANTDNVVFTADVNSHIIPNVDSAYDLGSASQQWRNLYIDGVGFIDNIQADDINVTGTVTVGGLTTLNGNVDIGNATSDTVSFTARIDTDLVPSTDNTSSLGSPTLEFKHLYLDGTAFVDDVTADSATIGTLKVSDLTSGRVVYAGTSGEITDNANLTFSGSVLNVGGNITLTGTVDGRDIAADGTLLDNHDAELGTITSGAMGTTASTVSGAIAELDSDRDRLVTVVEPTRALNTTATTHAAAINELKSVVDLLDSGASNQLTQIGDLANLTTTAKDTLVNAINELDSDIGARPHTTLNTTAKTLTGAINENEGRLDSNDTNFVTRVRGSVSASGDLTYNSGTGTFSIDIEQIYTKANFDSDLGDANTGQLPEGTNLYYTNARADARVNLQTGANLDLSSKSTSDLTEGTNLYYTTARADSDAKHAISATDNGGDGSFSYNSDTGVFTYTGPSASEVRAHLNVLDAGGDGSFAYDSASGKFTYTGPSASEVRAHLSAGGDLAYNSSTGVFSFTERTDAEVRGLVSATDAGGDGSFSYNSSTGAFTYTGPSASDVRAHFSATAPITLSSGVIAANDATTSTKGIASFSSTNFSVTSGAVSISNDGIARANLKDEVQLVIYNSAGTPVKTLYGAGS